MLSRSGVSKLFSSLNNSDHSGSLARAKTSPGEVPSSFVGGDGLIQTLRNGHDPAGRRVNPTPVVLAGAEMC